MDDAVSELDNFNSWFRSIFLKFDKQPVVNSRVGPLAENLVSFNERGESLDSILVQFEKDILPYVVKWNHPQFMGFFNSSSTLAGIAAETIISLVNTNCMTKDSSGICNEVDQVVIDWTKELLRIPHEFEGQIFSGGSLSNLHAMIAMRYEMLGDEFTDKGHCPSAGTCRIYLTAETHVSIIKSCIQLGFGFENLVFIPTDEQYAIDSVKLKDAILADLKNNFRPCCIIGNLGTTSTTSIDNLGPLVELSKKHSLWLHLDASHGGVLGMFDFYYSKFEKWGFANSITVNPHKWLFVPLGSSILFLKDRATLKKALAFEASYLNESFGEENYADYSLTLSRRFSSLSTWFTFKYLGKRKIREVIASHLETAKWLGEQISNHPRLHLEVPVIMSTVCFRLGNVNIVQDQSTKVLLETLRRKGFFLTGTNLKGKYVIRVVVSGFKTNRKTIESFVEVLTNLMNEDYRSQFENENDVKNENI